MKSLKLLNDEQKNYAEIDLNVSKQEGNDNDTPFWRHVLESAGGHTAHAALSTLLNGESRSEMPFGIRDGKKRAFAL